MKTLIREKQLKYTDVEEVRVLTNDRHMAEQIKSDSTLSVQGNMLRSKVESVEMNGPIVGEFGKIERQHNFESVVMNGVKTGKVGKLENCKIDEEM